jgi:hypothetical protein
MYSSRTKVQYATDITLGRIVRLKSYRVQRKKSTTSFVTACRLVAFSATFEYCLLRGPLLVLDMTSTIRFCPKNQLSIIFSQPGNRVPGKTVNSTPLIRPPRNSSRSTVNTTNNWILILRIIFFLRWSQE